MKTLKRAVLVVVSLLAVIGVGFAVTVQLMWKRTYEAPLPALKASTDPAVIERGRYLAEGPAHCVGCHVPESEDSRVLSGEIPDYVGGRAFVLPVGVIRSANITPDPETGIGRFSDELIARSLRYGVRHDGLAMIPFMPFNDLSEDDLHAVISYLRSRKPVKRAVENDRDLNLLGKAVMMLVIRPVGPTAPPPKSVTPGPTVEYGKYLAHNVANCHGCHTDRDLRTGEFIGKPFAGGFRMESLADPTKEVVSPNLTPDPKTSRIAQWSEDAFVQRLKSGVGMPGTHMPWVSFKNMTEDDLRAVYRYLKTVAPVENDPGLSVQDKAT